MNLHFFTGKSNGSETFCTLLLYKLFKLSNLFHNFWSYGYLLNFQITTDCPVLEDSVFRVLFAYFDASMASM